MLFEPVWHRGCLVIWKVAICKEHNGLCKRPLYSLCIRVPGEDIHMTTLDHVGQEESQQQSRVKWSNSKLEQKDQTGRASHINFGSCNERQTLFPCELTGCWWIQLQTALQQPKKVEKETTQPAAAAAGRRHRHGGEHETDQETKNLLKKVEQSSLVWRWFGTSSNTSSAVSSLSQVVVINTFLSFVHTPLRCRPHHLKGPVCRIFFFCTRTFSLRTHFQHHPKQYINGDLIFGDKHKARLGMTEMSIICR